MLDSKENEKIIKRCAQLTIIEMGKTLFLLGSLYLPSGCGKVIAEKIKALPPLKDYEIEVSGDGKYLYMPESFGAHDLSK